MILLKLNKNLFFLPVSKNIIHLTFSKHFKSALCFLHCTVFFLFSVLGSSHEPGSPTSIGPSLGHDQEESDGEESEEEGVEEGVGYEGDYFELLEKIAEDWLMTEIDHCVSKTAANIYWDIACRGMFQLFSLKKSQSVTRKTPKFAQLRKKFNNKVPPVNMEIGFMNKESGEIEVKKDLLETPVKAYPASEFSKAYEIASVKVSSFLIIALFSSFHYLLRCSWNVQN